MARLQAVLTLCALPAGLAAAGTLEVTVKDATGGILRSANVELKGPENRSAQTGPAGTCEFSDLAEGVYQIAVDRPGFVKANLDSITVGAAGRQSVHVTLSVYMGEKVIVTASKAANVLLDAPATVSVISGDSILNSSAQNYGDILRSVPGLNVIQLSAREVDVASRQGSQTLANSQLAVLDGRTIYADFFDLVFWDMIPTNLGDVKQIEVVRGPASAIWGANASTGVVNIITKTPRESRGTSVTMEGGGFSRDAGDSLGKSAGAMFGVNVSTAQAPNEHWSYRLSAGYFDSDPYARPTGQIPIAQDPLDPSILVGGASYQDQSYLNKGTRQPKFDARVDQELGDGGRVEYSAGVAASEGIIHTPIGPFDLQKNSYLGYGRVAYSKGGVRIQGFANILDGKAPNLVSTDAQGNPIVIHFKTETYDLEFGDTHLLGSSNVLTFGGNARKNVFDISIAPDAKNRAEFGAYVQDEWVLPLFRFAASGRVDKFGNLSEAFFSPRLSATFKPVKNQSLRIGFNRAFRAPSAIDNYLKIDLLGGFFPLGQVDPSFGNQQFPIVVQNLGNPNLQAQTLTAWELAYEATLGGRTNVSAALYLNDTKNTISTTTTPEALANAGIPPYYSSQNPPPGWPLPPQVLDLLAQQGVLFPAVFETLNVGGLRNKGFELSLEHSFRTGLSAFANYSYQATPEPLQGPADPNRIPLDSISLPPKNRFNLGANFDAARYLGSVSVNYADRAFWTDVLNGPFHGFTDAYTLLNASVGVHWAGGKLTTSLKGTNLLNHNVQQHIFGDILKRSILAEVRLNFQ